MKIDENTGLPELPEGYFWRVEHPTFWDFPDTNRLQVVLKKRVPDQEVKGKRNKVVQEPVPLPLRYIPQDPRRVDTQECKGTSDRAILGAAKVIMKRQKAKAKLDAKLGDYPPNKLGV